MNPKRIRIPQLVLHKPSGKAVVFVPGAKGRRDRYRDEQRTLLRMESRTFLNATIRVPTQIVRTGRRVVFRLMAYNRWLPALFRGVDGLRALRC